MTLVTAVDLASLFGTTKETVRRWASKEGLPLASRSPMRFDVDAARAWRESVLAERAARIGPEAFAKVVGGTSKHTVKRVATAAGLQPDVDGRFDKAALETAWAAEEERREAAEHLALDKKIVASLNRIIRKWERTERERERAARWPKPKPLGHWEIEIGALAKLLGVRRSRVTGWQMAKLAMSVQDIHGPYAIRTYDVGEILVEVERGRIVLGREAENRLKAEYEQRRDQQLGN